MPRKDQRGPKLKVPNIKELVAKYRTADLSYSEIGDILNVNATTAWRHRPSEEEVAV